MKPENGLCHPYPIPAEFVFYRHEYRTNVTVKSRRSTEWNGKILEASVKPIQPTAMTDKNENIKKSKHHSKLIFNPRISLTNHLLMDMASFEKSGDSFFLKDMNAILDEINADLDYGDFPTNSGLRNFLEAKERLINDIDPDVAASDVKRIWRGMECATAHRVQLIKHGLLYNEIALEFSLTKPAIEEACHRFEEDGRNEADSGNVVLSVVRSALC